MTTAMDTLRRYVNGAITLMLHMVAPPTAITDRSGSTAASLLARDRGTAGAAAAMAIAADTDTVAAGTGTAVMVDTPTADVADTVAVAMRAVHLMAAADGLAAAMAVGHAPLTVVAAVVPTVAAADTAAAGFAVRAAAAASAVAGALVAAALSGAGTGAAMAAADTGKSIGLRRKACLLRQAGLFLWLLKNGLIEWRGIPPFRQKKGERMGHGSF